MTVLTNGIRLLLIGDCRLAREALVTVLEASTWTSAVGGAASYAELAGRSSGEPPDVVLVDMNGPRGVHELRLVRENLPQTPVIALSVGDSDEELIAGAQAGASGFLDRTADLRALHEAIRRVIRGEAVCTPEMTAALLRRVAITNHAATPVTNGTHLTPREREVLLLIERGWTNKQIAAELGVELRTVKNHVHNVLDKLRVNRRGEAAARLRSARVPPAETLIRP